MNPQLRKPLRERLESLAFATRALARTGVLASISPRGLAGFVRSVRGSKPGAHLSITLHAHNNPHATAVVDSRRRLSWAELEREISQLMHGLAALGVGPGDRVAVMLPNCAETIASQQALLRMGAIAVSVPYRHKPPEIAYVLQNSAAKAAIVLQDYAAFMREAAAAAGNPPQELLVVVASGGTAVEPGCAYESLIAGQPTTAAQTGSTEPGGLMVYTSGTTGKPKGATRRIKDTGAEAVVDFLVQVGIRAQDRHLVVCPLYHSGAAAFVSFMTLLGAPNYLHDHFDPVAVLELIDRERITCAFMVPTMLTRLAALDEATRRKYDCSSLRWICSGAAPLPTATAQRFMAAFGPILWNFYGATETGLVSLAAPSDHLARPGTVGRLLRGNQARILGPDRTALPSDQVGELFVRNSMLVGGYHNNPEATASALCDGFFSVGDLGRLDSDGYLYLEGRQSDMVISGGVNIYPREIEDHLLTHPDVLEVAVVGIPDPEWGESLKAFVVRRPGSTLTAAEVVAHCNQSLANYKRPRQVAFVDQLPRNPTGKVLKRELRASDRS
jgi:fatty-acyl-CoA synthase